MTLALERGIGAFRVPPECEAHEPPEFRGLARDAVRLMVSERARNTLRHARFPELPQFLRPGDLLVGNDSATLPAALAVRRIEGGELMLHVSCAIADRLWVVEPRAHVRESEALQLPGAVTATLLTTVDRANRRLWYAHVDTSRSHVDYLHAHGSPIRYAYVEQPFPLASYQTVFARVPGSAEMPSAARPFSARTLDALAVRGVGLQTVTLHCGVSSAEAHEPPQPEYFDVPEGAARAVNTARAHGRHVVAIGTSVVRALESAARDGVVRAARGRTRLVISPEHPPQVIDGLLTGFHEPGASHLAMLAAFLDPPALRAAYAAALERGYLWHEFGDVHLIIG
jgi:S-adenosylmethionine:tRNA ribosyltransferase-isomerase